MNSFDMQYVFNQDNLRALVRGIRNWGHYEVRSERARAIGDLELAEMIIAAVRQWEGPGIYRITGPCDAADRYEDTFTDFEEFMNYMSNWSRTMRMMKVRDVMTSNIQNPDNGYEI